MTVCFLPLRHFERCCLWLWMIMPFVLLRLWAEKSPATMLLMPLGRGISPLHCTAVEMTVRWSGSGVISTFFHSPFFAFGCGRFGAGRQSRNADFIIIPAKRPPLGQRPVPFGGLRHHLSQKSRGTIKYRRNPATQRALHLTISLYELYNKY